MRYDLFRSTSWMVSVVSKPKQDSSPSSSRAADSYLLRKHFGRVHNFLTVKMVLAFPASKMLVPGSYALLPQSGPFPSFPSFNNSNAYCLERAAASYTCHLVKL